jgi:hypothetical protein
VVVAAWRDAHARRRHDCLLQGGNAQESSRVTRNCFAQVIVLGHQLIVHLSSIYAEFQRFRDCAAITRGLRPCHATTTCSKGLGFRFTIPLFMAANLALAIVESTLYP